MSKRRSNKSVKRMMVDVFNGEWVDYNSKGQRYYGNGMELHVLEAGLVSAKQP